jgi:hypothetical protein
VDGLHVKGIRMDQLTLMLVTAMVGAQSAMAEVVEALEMEDEAVADSISEAADLLEKSGPLISKELGLVLISPLVLFKLVTLATGEKLKPYLDFAILASLLAFAYKWLYT